MINKVNNKDETENKSINKCFKMSIKLEENETENNIKKYIDLITYI